MGWWVLTHFCFVLKGGRKITSNRQRKPPAAAVFIRLIFFLFEFHFGQPASSSLVRALRSSVFSSADGASVEMGPRRKLKKKRSRLFVFV